MSSNSQPPQLIKGDVVPGGIRRISGTPGTDDGLIEVTLVGHPYRYQVRVEMGTGAPRLTELHLIPLDPAVAAVDIDPGTIRLVPVRRLAKAAARFIARHDGAFVGVQELRDPTLELQPERPPNGGRRRKLDDTHYRQVAYLLTAAREAGESPREYVAERLEGSLPTVDRWIAEAKKRGHLRRDWSMTTITTDANEEH
ncbi:hypothetical protein [Mycobacteroides abscessus]|uniref:hypothetical protein n=1 Tax=Mycobacteroides abscessus TaxID=36809 RepID=UPI000C26485A|nr:hypothetical protein [Mycobacteroides abscessus]PVB44271.1 hypothetical protein DDJ39_15015 [Mycobacteroides abscessus]